MEPSFRDEEWSSDVMSLDDFRSRVRECGKREYRDLPWRYIDDAYGVLVSEVMLQQTQVSRVLGRWERFMRLFPTVDALASADSAAVVAEWQGLGYNRRALALWRAAGVCAREFGGALPCSYEDLVGLPGVGPATAGGVLAFAHNEPCVYLETNVRTVFLHELFPDEEGVADSALVPLIRAACPHDDPRSWYYALLDYGAYLKRTVPNPSRRSKSHVRQSAFQGSRRQKRAEVLRIVLASDGGISSDQVREELDRFERSHARDVVSADEFDAIVRDLVAEGFFTAVGSLLKA